MNSGPDLSRSLPPQEPVGPPQLSGRRTWKWIAWCVVAIGLIWLVSQYLWLHTITVSPETTWFTEPLDESGFVVLEEAINQLAKGDTTPDQNAAVLLAEALGPGPFGLNGVVPDEFYERLRILRPTTPQFPAFGRVVAEPQPLDVIRFANNKKDVPDIVQWQPWTAERFPDAATWLGGIETPLRLTVDASRRTSFYSPTVRSMSASGQPEPLLNESPTPPWTRLTDALAVRANLRLGEGRFDDAVSDIVALYRLSILLASDLDLINRLQAYRVQVQAFHCTLTWIELARPDNSAIEQMVEALDRLPDLASMANVVQRERAIFVDSIVDMSRGQFDTDPLPPPLRQIFPRGVAWDQILRDGNAVYDEMLRIASLTDSLKCLQAEEKLQQRIGEFHLDQWKSLKGVLFSGTFGNTRAVESTFMTGLGVVPCSARFRVEQRTVTLRIALELARWRNEHDRYPDRLEEVDLMSLGERAEAVRAGKYYQYQRTEDGYLLTDFGIDQTRDQANPVPPGRPGRTPDDIIIRMPRDESSTEDQP